MLYPNPASEKLTVNSPDWDSVVGIEISDVAGKLVFHKTGNKMDNQLILNHLSAGIYFLKTENKNSIVTTYKFVVK
ncbi:T9SS type A sorting domain-containing protein [Dyadobacter sp. NIV53]|uniref:T9SS type A sorting domain-containing protein n=1 Tax=Dyadobacter sp. NIV53 TaxID=2861765 RepID=UPI001C889CCA